MHSAVTYNCLPHPLQLNWVVMYTVKTKAEFCRARNYVLNLALATVAAFDLYFASVCNNIIAAIW